MHASIHTSTRPYLCSSLFFLFHLYLICLSVCLLLSVCACCLSSFYLSCALLFVALTLLFALGSGVKVWVDGNAVMKILVSGCCVWSRLQCWLSSVLYMCVCVSRVSRVFCFIFPCLFLSPCLSWVFVCFCCTLMFSPNFFLFSLSLSFYLFLSLSLLSHWPCFIVLPLQNTTMDYVEDEMGQRFVFENPQVVGKCACGSSWRTWSLYIFIYIYRERERKKERKRERESVCVCVLYTYLCLFMWTYLFLSCIIASCITSVEFCIYSIIVDLCACFFFSVFSCLFRCVYNSIRLVMPWAYLRTYDMCTYL